MTSTLTIAKRELTSLFYSPIAYVVLAIFALLTSFVFFSSFAPGQPATLRGVLVWSVWFLIFLAPAISMRLMSEEFRSGTIETLITAPVSDAQVIVGKWLGALGFLIVVLFVPIAIMWAVLLCFSNPDFGPLASGAMGLILVGGLYLAIGTFASTVTQNQIIAFLITLFIICMISLLVQFIAGLEFITPQWRAVFQYIDVSMQYEDFSKGLIDTSNFIYFISGIAMFLFFAIKLLESRRWR